MEELRAAVPRISFSEFDAEHNMYAMQLRKIDSAIQQANWSVDVGETDDCFEDYVRKDEKDE